MIRDLLFLGRGMWAQILSQQPLNNSSFTHLSKHYMPKLQSPGGPKSTPPPSFFMPNLPPFTPIYLYVYIRKFNEFWDNNSISFLKIILIYPVNLQPNTEKFISKCDPHLRVPSANLPNPKRWNRRNQTLNSPTTPQKLLGQASGSVSPCPIGGLVKPWGRPAQPSVFPLSSFL